MSADVLFDAPGPRTRARHRVYTAVTVVALVALLGLVVLRLGQTGQLDYDLWEPFVTPRYLRALVVDGLLVTLRLALFSVLFALVLGVVLGVGKLSDVAAVRAVCWLLVEFFRAVPVLLLMIFFFAVYGITRGESGAFWSVVAALTLYNGAVLAEIVRAGILAVPHGQAEAAYAIGLTKGQATRVVLLPQAVKIMIPSIVSQAIVTLKDTSLGAAVAAPGLTAVGELIQGQFRNFVPTTIVLAAVYIVLNLLLTALAVWLQRRYVGERRPTGATTDLDTGRGL